VMAREDAATRLATLAMLEPGAREQALAALSPAQKPSPSRHPLQPPPRQSIERAFQRRIGLGRVGPRRLGRRAERPVRGPPASPSPRRSQPPRCNSI
jgi:hypothetical protein